MAKPKSPRTHARQLALQALYQWQYTRQPAALIEEQFLADPTFVSGAQVELFRALLHGITAQAEALDAELAPLLDRPLVQIGAVERAALWIGLYELIHSPEVPCKVAINEAVELSKLFGAEKSHNYINGVLDRAARRKRPGEMAGRAG